MGEPNIINKYVTAPEKGFDTKTSESNITVIFVGGNRCRNAYDEICKQLNASIGYQIILVDSPEDVISYPDAEAVIFHESVNVLNVTVPDSIATFTIYDNPPQNANEEDSFASSGLIASDEVWSYDKKWNQSKKTLEDIAISYSTRSTDIIRLMSLIKRKEKLIAQNSSIIAEIFKGLDSSDSILAQKDTILNLYGTKDLTTRSHIEGMLVLETCLAQALELDGEKSKTISAAILLHDIGKLNIPDQLLKNDDTFSSEEYNVMKTHIAKCSEIAESDIYTLALTHHTQLDGNGYDSIVNGVATQIIERTNIPPEAQMLCILDSFEAITSNKRAYSQNPNGYPESYNHDIKQLPYAFQCLRTNKKFNADYSSKFMIQYMSKLMNPSILESPEKEYYSACIRSLVDIPISEFQSMIVSGAKLGDNPNDYTQTFSIIQEKQNIIDNPSSTPSEIEEARLESLNARLSVMQTYANNYGLSRSVSETKGVK